MRGMECPKKWWLNVIHNEIETSDVFEDDVWDRFKGELPVCKTLNNWIEGKEEEDSLMYLLNNDCDVICEFVCSTIVFI